jgi:hypothetical protein
LQKVNVVEKAPRSVAEWGRVRAFAMLRLCACLLVTFAWYGLWPALYVSSAFAQNMLAIAMTTSLHLLYQWVRAQLFYRAALALESPQAADEPLQPDEEKRPVHNRAIPAAIMIVGGIAAAPWIGAFTVVLFTAGVVLLGVSVLYGVMPGMMSRTSRTVGLSEAIAVAQTSRKFVFCYQLGWGMMVTVYTLASLATLRAHIPLMTLGPYTWANDTALFCVVVVAGALASAKMLYASYLELQEVRAHRFDRRPSA